MASARSWVTRFDLLSCQTNTFKICFCCSMDGFLGYVSEWMERKVYPWTVVSISYQCNGSTKRAYLHLYIYIVRRSIKTMMTTRRRCANRYWRKINYKYCMKIRVKSKINKNRCKNLAHLQVFTGQLRCLDILTLTDPGTHH